MSSPDDDASDETDLARADQDAADTGSDHCGAACRDGTPCRKPPLKGAERCRFHGGASTGPPAGSANALKHGATASPITLPDHLDDDDVEWIEALVDAYLAEAPFGSESPQVERLTRTCVMIYQEWAGQRYVFDEGMATEDVVGVTDAGEPVVRTDEHYLCQRIDRLNDKIRMNLKDLGLLDDPESQRAGVEQDKAAALRELMNRADQVEQEQAEQDQDGGSS